MTGISSAQDQWVRYVEETSGKAKKRYRLAYGLYGIGALLFLGAIGAEFEIWSVPFLPLLVPGLALIAGASILLVFVSSSLDTGLLKAAVAEALGGQMPDGGTNSKTALEPLMQKNGSLRANYWFRMPTEKGELTVATATVVRHKGDMAEQVLEGVYVSNDEDTNYTDDTVSVINSRSPTLKRVAKLIPKGDTNACPESIAKKLGPDHGLFGATMGKNLAYFATDKSGTYSASAFRSPPADLPGRIAQSVRDAVALMP